MGLTSTGAGVLTVLALVVALAVVHKPLGDHLTRAMTATTHLRVERVLYKLARIDSEADQRWTAYVLSLLGFSLAGLLVLYALQRTQQWLPLSLGLPAVPPEGAFNTAVSFVTNTNWQWYSGESTMGHVAQMAGLAVQNFVSAAVGIAVVVALVRGFTRSRSDRLGSFWVDLVRATVRVLLPLSLVAAVVLVCAGGIQNLAGPTDVATVTGGSQTLPGGPPLARRRSSSSAPRPGAGCAGRGPRADVRRVPTTGRRARRSGRRSRSRGLARAVGAELVADDTPGGGLTMTIALPVADGPDRSAVPV